MHSKVINFLDTETYTTTGVLNFSWSRCNLTITQWLESTDTTVELYSGNPFIDDPDIIEICDITVSDVGAGDLEFLVYKNQKIQINEDPLRPVYSHSNQLKVEENPGLVSPDIG